jgi:rRNA biogenesis protein RRP5
MSTLKRKDAPGGHPPAKSAKNTKEGRPTKKDDTSKDAKPMTKAATASERQPKATVVSVLKDEEPMFPRGGGSVLTPLEQKQIQLEAKADALREEEFDTGKTGTKKKNAAKVAKAAKKGKKGTDNAPQEDHVKVESLSFKVNARSSSQLFDDSLD